MPGGYGQDGINPITRALLYGLFSTAYQSGIRNVVSVWRLDRLGRFTRDVLNLVHDLDQKALRCVSLSRKFRRPAISAG